jgi:MFS family permease
LNAAAPLLRRDPESMGLDPDGIPRSSTAIGTTEGWSLVDAFRSRTFWAVAGTMTLHWIPIFIPFVHLVPLARDLGYSPLIASAAVSMTGIGAMAGRLALGFASDLIGRKLAFAVSLVLQTAAFLALASVESLAGLYAAALTFGFSYGGASTLFPAIVGDLFGRERAGALVGFIFAVGGAMGAWGPLIAGAIYDARGSYAVAFVGSAVTNVLALVALALARPEVARTR